MCFAQGPQIVSGHAGTQNNEREETFIGRIGVILSGRNESF